ncbi:MAG: chemotaxis protein CheX [Desulfatiglandales bacterium]
MRIDLRSFVTNGVKEVFDKMLSMGIRPVEISPTDTIEGSKVVGSVSFAGAILGSVNIHIPNQLSKVLAAGMLGLSPEDIEGDDEVNDVVGELSNMIGGYLKSRFCDAGFPCELSIPSVTKGSDFRVESLQWDTREKFGFEPDGGRIILEVFLKRGA